MIAAQQRDRLARDIKLRGATVQSRAEANRLMENLRSLASKKDLDEGVRTEVQKLLRTVPGYKP